MKIRLAKTAGFCMGVRRAVDMALDLKRVRPPAPIVTYGPLIHNPQTLELLESRGIRMVNRLDEIEAGTVVIRAHGISPSERSTLKARGLTIIDATCPRVARVQAVIRKHAAKGHFCVIVGDDDHPEVRGLLGFAAAGGLAIGSPEEMELFESLNGDREICVVAQTTQEPEIFRRVVALLAERCPKLHVYDTICDSTKKRQDEVCRLARQVDMVVVVGGRGSGNTRRLVKVAQAQGIEALHVETAEEIPSAAVAGSQVVGVTAGASTPNWQIQRVIDRLREIGMTRAATPLKRLRRVFDVAVMTYMWAAFGGGGLTVACLMLQGRDVTVLPPLTAMLFVFSMHLLNRILERSGAVRFNTPEVAAFYARHHVLLSALGVASSVAALAAGLTLGAYCFALLAAMIAGGLLYTLPVEMPSWIPIKKWRSLKEIPGSKTPLVALGWAMAAAVLPAAESPLTVDPVGLAVAFVFAAGMIFWRTTLSDLLDIQGDRLVGRETIPILIGVTKAGRLLVGLLVLLGVLLVVAASAGWVKSVGYWLVVNCLVFGLLFLVYKGRHLVDRLWLDGMLDGNLLCAGALAMTYGAG
ncbi:MAG: 4-hydroxy-3-methylbut-2-enyl diphosphate reductase [Desulfomonile sp.]|nr:4-hydroxy-3-methylbut-2-enyl diphosphate reductase [Desulfomonile sp.]